MMKFAKFAFGYIKKIISTKNHRKWSSFGIVSEGPSGGSRAAAVVADGCREVEEPSSPGPGGWSRSACTSATTIPVAELVDTWPPISSGSA